MSYYQMTKPSWFDPMFFAMFLAYFWWSSLV